MTVGKLKEELEYYDDALTVNVIATTPKSELKAIIEGTDEDGDILLVGYMGGLYDKLQRGNNRSDSSH